MARIQQAAQMLFRGEKKGVVAETLGIHRATLWRWRQKREFKAELRRLEYNEDRRRKRLIARIEREAEQHWQRTIEEAEMALVDAIAGGDRRQMERAWKAREKALLRGFTAAEAEDIIFFGAPVRRNKTRRKRK